MKISEKIGVDYTSWGRWERGEFFPTIENIEKIATAFKIHPSALFSEELQSYKPKADPNPTLEALSELVVEQKQRLKALELSSNEQRIIEAYRQAGELQRIAIEQLAGFGLDSEPDSEILKLTQELTKKIKKKSS